MRYCDAYHHYYYYNYYYYCDYDYHYLQSTTGVCEQTSLRRRVHMGKLKNTKSVAGEQLMLLDCMAKACVK